MFRECLGLVVFSLLLASVAHAFDVNESVPERREDTSKLEHGALFFPVFSHVPGIGSMYGAGVLGNNVLGTRANLEAVASSGDTSTALLSMTEVHLIKDTLVTSYYLYSTAIPFQIYDRGIQSDSGAYFNSLNAEYGGSTEIDLNFWERRLQFNTQVGASRLRYKRITNADGVGFSNVDNSEFDSFNPTFRLVVDLTDDNVDPHRGLKLQVIRDQTLLYDGLHSKFSTWYGILTAYVPVIKRSTWAFNAFRSSAAMDQANPLSYQQLQTTMGLGCDLLGDPGRQAACQATERSRIQDRLRDNRSGTAGMLGGPEEMRGFPLNRFRGSQTMFYATELRYNFIDDNTKFDFGFVSGTLSTIQLAPFYEIGTVCDAPQTVEQSPYRSNAGVGLRFGFSGMLVRADVGFSDEGPQFTFFVGYPWDQSPF